jgi:hypothetical protein
MAAELGLTWTRMGVGDQDQILRSFEDAPSLLDLLLQRALVAVPLGDVAGGLGDADDRA